MSIKQTATSITEPVPQKRSSWPILLCYGGMIVIAIAVNLPPVYLTTFGQTFGGTGGLSDQQLGLIGTLVFVGLIVGMLVSGPLADRLGPRTFVVLGSTFIAGGLGLIAFAPSYPALLLAACIMGIGTGTLDMILSPIVTALCPDRRTSALNWLHAFYSIGAVLTTLLAALMIRLSMHWAIFHWRNVCLGLMAMPMAILLGFLFAPLPTLVAENKQRTSALTLLSHLAFWGSLFTMLLAGATELGMAQWLPAYAEKGLGYPKWAAGLALTAFSVVMAMGRLLGGAIAGRISPARILLVCCGLSAVLYVMGALCPVRPVALASCVMVGLAISCMWPTTLGLTADRFPHGGATMFAMLAAFGNAGGIMNAVIGGIADHTNLHVALAAVAVCPVIMGVLVCVQGRGKR